MSNAWKNVRLKNYSQILLSNIDKKSYDGEDAVLLCNYTDVYKNKRIHKNINFMPATASKTQIGKLTLRYKDVIITKDSESADDIGIPSVVEYTAPNLVCGYHLAIIRSKKLNGDFISYLFQSKVAKDYFLEVCLGFTRVSLNKGDILNFKFNMPPLPQQAAIANYLDYHTTKIDKEISLLEQKVEKLDEYKKSLIYETVTKGLDKNVPMKDSGIKWIGMIPEYWEVKRLKNITYINKGKSFSEELEEENGSLPYINGGMYPSGWTNSFNANKDTIAVSEGGASAGYSQFMKTKYWAGDHCYIVKTRSNCFIQYAFYVLKGYEKNIMGEKKGSAMPNLQKTKFVNYAVPFNNNLVEQQQIAEYLDKQCSIIDKKKELINKKVELLKEYKQSLIYESVTGKIEIGE